jgi:hypothetical protein
MFIKQQKNRVFAKNLVKVQVHEFLIFIYTTGHQNRHRNQRKYLFDSFMLSQAQSNLLHSSMPASAEQHRAET